MVQWINKEAGLGWHWGAVGPAYEFLILHQRNVKPENIFDPSEDRSLRKIKRSPSASLKLEKNISKSETR
jgi:hypothetical protein